MAQTVEIPQSLFGEKIAAIPEVTTVRGRFREILTRGVAPNTEADSFIDDLSSVGSKGLNHLFCEVLFHAGMKRTMKRIAQQSVGSQAGSALKKRRVAVRDRAFYLGRLIFGLVLGLLLLPPLFLAVI